MIINESLDTNSLGGGVLPTIHNPILPQVGQHSTILQKEVFELATEIGIEQNPLKMNNLLH